MRNQKQPKDSNWYNNRFVLSWLFLGVYIFVPVFFTIWGYNQRHHEASTLSDIIEWLAIYDTKYNWLIVCYLCFVLLFTFVLVLGIKSSEKEKVRIKLLKSILNGYVNEGVEVKKYNFFSCAYCRNLCNAIIGRSDVSPTILNTIESSIISTGGNGLAGIINDTVTD